jgi:hypothetical protein
MEVIQEIVADIIIKKDGKIDNGIKFSNKDVMLVECKTCGAFLNQEIGISLVRYFHTNVTNLRRMTYLHTI